MSWLAKSDGLRRHTHRIGKGAVPLGQHSHSPERVLGTTPAPVRVSSLPGVPVDAPTAHPPTGVYPGLAKPAPPARRCSSCTSAAVLLDPATDRSYCAGCWMSHVVCGQLD